MAKTKWFLIISIYLLGFSSYAQRAKRVFTDNDSTFNIIENLAKTPTVEHLKDLEAIMRESDGALAEHLTDTPVGILENDPIILIDYLGSNPQSPIFEFLVDGLSLKSAIEKIDPYTLKKQFAPKLATDLQKKTLNDIFAKVDPKKFE